MSFLRSTLAPRHLVPPMTPYSRTIPSLPFEILLILLAQDPPPPRALLAKLCLLNSDVRALVLPYLYRRVLLDRDSVKQFIWGIEVKRPKDGPGSFVFRPPPSTSEVTSMDRLSTTSGSGSGKARHSLASAQPSVDTEKRKRHALSLVRMLVLTDGVDAQTAETWLHAIDPPSLSPSSSVFRPTPKASTTRTEVTALMPRLERVVIHAETLLQFVQWRYMSKDRGRDHDFVRVLRALISTSTPGERRGGQEGYDQRSALDPLDTDTPHETPHSPTQSPRRRGVTVEIRDSFSHQAWHVHTRDIRYHHITPDPNTTLRLGCDIVESMLAPDSDQANGAGTAGNMHGLLDGAGAGGPNRRIARFTWHRLTTEKLPYVDADTVEWHFVDPASGSETGRGSRPTDESTRRTTTMLQRAANIRAVLLRDQERYQANQQGQGQGQSTVQTQQLPVTTSTSTDTDSELPLQEHGPSRYLITGAGLGLDAPPDNSPPFGSAEPESDPRTLAYKRHVEERMQAALCQAVRTGGDLGAALPDELWERVEWITSPSRHVSAEEEAEVGGGCGCYPRPRPDSVPGSGSASSSDVDARTRVDGRTTRLAAKLVYVGPSESAQLEHEFAALPDWVHNLTT